LGELWDKLSDLSKSNMYPFHMPGHKRNASCGMDTALLFDHDITEIDDFDNLHDARDLLRTCQNRANDLYKAGETFFLVNGSTCGVLSAISAVTADGDTILTARNCHKSLYHAAYLRNLNLRYLYPENIEGYDFCGAVTKASVEEALGVNKDIKAVFITSPTYEGVYSDVRAIADVAHSHNIPLIVDEAHGAHLGIAKGMPEGAITQGADIVIHSLHKTLPCITQSALLHVSGSYVDRDRLKRFLRIYQTSSPSYLMMASIDDGISYMTRYGDDFATKLLSYHDKILANTRKLKHLIVPDYSVIADPCKIVIACKDNSITGSDIYDHLRNRYALQPEMACKSYVLMIITGMDTLEGIERLIEAIKEIDKDIDKKINKDIDTEIDTVIEDKADLYDLYNAEDTKKQVDSSNAEDKINPGNLSMAESRTDSYTPCDIKMTLTKAWDTDHEEILLDKADGRIAADFVNLYPPGIPLVVPGEVITNKLIDNIKENLTEGLNVQGISEGRLIRVVKWGK